MYSTAPGTLSTYALLSGTADAVLNVTDVCSTLDGLAWNAFP